MSDAQITIREGSSLYYSLLWMDEPSRERASDRLALIAALASTLDDVQEPQVAEKKIHWWHEELQRLNDGCARHPAMQRNQEALKGLDLAQATCLDIVSAAATQRFTPFSTNEENDTNLLLSFRARLALFSHALSDDTADLDINSHPTQAALAFAHHEQLVRLPGLIHRGLPVFSDELYKRFGIRPNDLAEHVRIADVAEPDDHTNSGAKASPPSQLKNIPLVVEKPGRQQLLAHAVEHSRLLLHEATANDAIKQRYRRQPLLPVWRLLILRRHQLDIWNKKQPDLLRERCTLTPLSKFFRSWQNRR